MNSGQSSLGKIQQLRTKLCGGSSRLVGLPNDQFIKRVEASKLLFRLDVAAIELVDAAIADRAIGVETCAQLTNIRKKLGTEVGEKEAHTRLIVALMRHVQRVLNRERQGWRVTSSKSQKSVGCDHEFSVIDGFAPPVSPMFHSPRFCWHPDKVGDGWLRIDFPAERAVSAFAVFWFWDDFGVNPPGDWKLEYLAADKKTWRAVPNPTAYEKKGNVFNKVQFDEVKTSALRLVVTFNGAKSAGVHEIRVK